MTKKQKIQIGDDIVFRYENGKPIRGIVLLIKNSGVLIQEEKRPRNGCWYPLDSISLT